MITLEKLLVLKSIEIFKYTPDEVLIELASSASEAFFRAGDTIMRKDDFGDSMFVIVTGKVHILDGETVLAEMGEYDVFGELAALSPEKRTASVVAKQDLLTLKITNKTLYEIMDLNIGLAKGVIHALCQRYRNISKQLHESITVKN